MLAHHPLVRVGVAGVSGVGADHGRKFRAAPVGGGGHQRGDGSGQRTSAFGVIALAQGHQQRAEVRVADPQLAVVAGRLRDRVGREVGEGDRDIHGCNDELDRLDEPLHVEGVIGAQELQQVQAGQVARRIVQAHVLRARVGRGDAPRLGVGVPVVDRVVVLQSGIGALPGSLRDLVEQFAGVHLFDDLAGHPRTQPELAAVQDGLHELVTDPHRVVRVLVLHRGDVLAAQVHVEAGVTQRTDLVLLARLGLDELLDVGMVDVEHHHLGRPAGGPA